MRKMRKMQFRIIGIIDGITFPKLHLHLKQWQNE